MASSVVELCNIALVRLGGTTITSLSEDSKAARVCNTLYAQIRDAVLRDGFWNFSIRRVNLAELPGTPFANWTHHYTKPDDLIRMISINGDANYTIEGSIVLTDVELAEARYISRVEDVTIFDSSFVDALTFRMASELSIPIADDTNRGQALFSLYLDALSKARTNQSQEALNPGPGLGEPDIIDGPWIEARH